MRKFLKNLFRKKKSSNKKIISEIGKGKDQEINEENFKDKIKYEEEKLKKAEFFLNKSLEINPKDITALNKLPSSRYPLQPTRG